ncbi:AraC family transcriptional regulator [Promicromonospora sp. NPDC050249]|uniref:helix-turn-helix domain-containing protein n=1 Tax=Promicromonospora sp. NPDC050249 TaxID=3154743 RepID=UPI0033D545A5
MCLQGRPGEARGDAGELVCPPDEPGRRSGYLLEPPMRYLAGWRLEQAYTALTTTTDSVATISRRVGYGSEAAFGRAFKRHHGTSPGAVRRSGPARSAGSLRTAADAVR